MVSVMRHLGWLLVLLLGLAACGDDVAVDDDLAVDDENGEPVADDDWPDELIFAAVPAEEAEELVESWEPLLEGLEDRLGIPISFQTATDYAAVVEAQVAERADFAFYGPFGYVVATIAGADIEAVIAQIPEPGEPPGYQSYLVTTADRDDINAVEDVEGKTVCLVDPASTSGGLFPTAMLLAAGLDVDTDMTAVYSGAHDSSVLSVLSGDCDAGFAFDSMVDEILPGRGFYEPDEIKIVDRSEIIPGSPIAVGNWLPEDLRLAIQEGIVELNAEVLFEEGYCPEGRVVTSVGEYEGPEMCLIGDEARWGAEAVDDAYYDGIREVCELTGAPACEP